MVLVSEYKNDLDKHKDSADDHVENDLQQVSKCMIKTNQHQLQICKNKLSFHSDWKIKI